MKKEILLLVFLFARTMGHAQEFNKPFAVAELFTAEGCSSCPPADKVLSDLIADAEKNNKNIFCLEYHVDYWNRSGWKDPFSKNQFSQRQNIYSSLLHQPDLYTPQMIVNGETEFTGSHAEEARAAVDKALQKPASMSLEIQLDSVYHDSLYVHYESSQTDKNFSLHVALVESNLSSKVLKGENTGKLLHHDHVVRVFYSAPMAQKKSGLIIPIMGTKLNAACNLIAFVQNKQTMKIIAAVQKDFAGIKKE